MFDFGILNPWSKTMLWSRLLRPKGILPTCRRFKLKRMKRIMIKLSSKETTLNKLIRLWFRRKKMLTRQSPKKILRCRIMLKRKLSRSLKLYWLILPLFSQIRSVLSMRVSWSTLINRAGWSLLNCNPMNTLFFVPNVFMSCDCRLTKLKSYLRSCKTLSRKLRAPRQLFSIAKISYRMLRNIFRESSKVIDKSSKIKWRSIFKNLGIKWINTNKTAKQI